MNRNCSACNIKIDVNNYKKDRTVCKSCYNRNKNKRKNNDNNTLIQPSKIDKINNNNDIIPNDETYENHACVVIGPRNVGKTYYSSKY